MNKQVIISDPTLRDGSHAIKHQLTVEYLDRYSQLAEHSGIPILEVGHGNGLGASSLQLGESLVSDSQMLEICRKNLKNTKLAVHVIPGFATINRDLRSAIDIGVDIIRVASHCTEADITKRHIQFAREKGKTVYGVLMMSHMADVDTLVGEAQKMKEYGAQGIVIMDSAGAYLPENVNERIHSLVNNLHIPIGFHAHNNLGMGIANSITALKAGAVILDGSIRGFGAGAGNAQLEVLIAVLHQMGYQTGINLFDLLDVADEMEIMFAKAPTISSTSIISGLTGVFSAFAKPVERIAKQYNVSSKEIFLELGRRKVVAGQEDLILEVALELARK